MADISNSSGASGDDSPLMPLAEPEGGYEIGLQTAWNAIRPGRTLKAEDGRVIRVASPGRWNVEAGPDFVDARIEIDGVEVVGDVEAHLRPADWFAHRHHLDPAYGRVVLHVVSLLDAERPGPPGLATVLVPPRKRQTDDTTARKYKNGLCAAWFAARSDEEVRTLLTAAGKERFEQKCAAVATAVEESDQDTVCWRLIADALGYKRNRGNFVSLCGRFLEYPRESRRDEYETIIWGESGLLPDTATAAVSEEMRERVVEMWRRWWLTRQGARPPLEWVRAGVRPLNSPERRVAAFTLLYAGLGESPLETLAARISPASAPGVFLGIVRSLVPGNHPFWSHYTNFRDRRARPAAVLGRDRLVELAANVLLPILRVHAWNSGDARLAEFAESAWLRLPASQDNWILKVAAHKWFMPPGRLPKLVKTAAAAQGVIHLHRGLCESRQMECGSCPMTTLEPDPRGNTGAM